MSQKNKLRVWWIPQVPGEPFYVSVKNINEAKLIFNTLADYDLFQLAKHVKPDYSNAGGLQYWDEKENDWVEWEDKEGRSIDDIIRDDHS